VRSIVTDRVAWSVVLSVGLIATLVSCVITTTELMPFGLSTRVGPGNHVLDGGPDPPMGRGNCEGKWASHSKVGGHSAVICAKPAETIEMPFGLWPWIMGLRNRVLDGSPDPPWEWATLGKGAPIVKYRNTLRSPGRKQLNRS